MAESSRDFRYEDPDVDYRLDHDDNDDDETEVDITWLFQPGATSTLYHSVERIEMETGTYEPDTSYREDTPLLVGFLD